MKRYKRFFMILSTCIAGLLLILVILTTLSSTSTAGVQWRGVTVGRSTFTGAISQLGWPGRTAMQPSTMEIIFYYYDDQSHWEADVPCYQLTFSWNKLTQITDFAPLEGSGSSLETFIMKYGKPDYVTWAGSMRGGLFRSLVFLDDGVLLLVLPTFDMATSSVIEAKYLQPCSLACIKQEFPFDFGSGPPNPEFGPLNPIDKIEDPWRFTTRP